MCIYTVDRVEKKGTIHNSFLTYGCSITVLRAEEDSPERYIAASKNVCPKLSKLKRIRRAISVVETY